ncbi:PEP-CTERM sorting domain-containing protein [Microcystis sp. LE18-22.4A]|uniref:PEP-CTERM sorting domain-containing protein n=1 Tax=Microcystis sp. LE18-22.4A TaxID=3016432 RepID=UPI00338F8E6B
MPSGINAPLAPTGLVFSPTSSSNQVPEPSSLLAILLLGTFGTIASIKRSQSML